MILGISLVVQELHKGPRLVFRYPEEGSDYFNRALNKSIDEKNGIQNINNDNFAGSKPSDAKTHGAKEQQNNRSYLLRKAYKQYFNLSDENFAKLFRNKNTKNNKVLELAIGDLHLISLPFNLGSQSPDNTTSNTAADLSIGDYQDNASITTSYSNIEDDGDSTKDIVSMFNIVIATVSGNLMRQIYPNYSYKCQQHKYTSIPGEDPMAAAMGLRQYTYGSCRQSLRRVLEVASNTLYYQEQVHRYLTKEVGQMIKIIDSQRKYARHSSLSGNNNSGGAGGITNSLTSSGTTSPLVHHPYSFTSSHNNTDDDLHDLHDSHHHHHHHTASSSHHHHPMNPPVAIQTSPGYSLYHEAHQVIASSSSAPTITTEGNEHHHMSTMPLIEIKFPLDPMIVDEYRRIFELDSNTVVNPQDLELFAEEYYYTQQQQQPQTAAAYPPQSHQAYLHPSATANTSYPPMHPTSSHPISRTHSPMPLPSNSSAITSNSSSMMISTTSTISPTTLPSPSSLTNTNNNNPLFDYNNSSSNETNTTNKEVTTRGSQHFQLMLMTCTLVHELRLLFYSLVDGYSAKIQFHESKLQIVPLICMNPRMCSSNNSELLCGLSGIISGGLLEHNIPPNRYAMMTNTNNNARYMNCNHNNSNSNSNAMGSFPSQYSLLSGMPSASPTATTATTATAAASATNVEAYTLLDPTIPTLPPSIQPPALLLQSQQQQAAAAAAAAGNKSIMKGMNLNTQTILLLGEPELIIKMLTDLERQHTTAMSMTSITITTGMKIMNTNRIIDDKRLIYFIEHLHPLKSLAELSICMDEPVEELISMANYLHHFGLAEIIPLIYQQAIYQIHSTAPLYPTSSVARAYERLLLRKLEIKFPTATAANALMFPATTTTTTLSAPSSSNTLSNSPSSSQLVSSTNAATAVIPSRVNNNPVRRTSPHIAIRKSVSSSNTATVAATTSMMLQSSMRLPSTFATSASLAAFLGNGTNTSNPNQGNIAANNNSSTNTNIVANNSSNNSNNNGVRAASNNPWKAIGFLSNNNTNTNNQPAITTPSLNTSNDNTPQTPPPPPSPPIVITNTAEGYFRHVPCIDLDHPILDIPGDCTLPYILSLWNGSRTLYEWRTLLPSILREYAMDILVFLLRWHMISPITTYLVNYFTIPSCLQALMTQIPNDYIERYQARQLQQQNQIKPQLQQQQQQRVSKISLGSTIITNSFLPTIPSQDVLDESKHSIGFDLSEHGLYGNNNSHHGGTPPWKYHQNAMMMTTVEPATATAAIPASNTDLMNSSPLLLPPLPEEEMTVSNADADAELPVPLPLPPIMISWKENPWIEQLSTEEKECLTKLTPYLLNTTMSTKSVPELLWIVKITSHQLQQLLSKLPYLSLVAKSVS